MKIKPKQIIAALIGWIILITLIVLSLASCSPVKKLERLHKKHPYLFTAKIDTLKIIDTTRLVIPGVQTDTIVSYESLTDTLYLDKERLHIKVIRTHGDKLYISGKCDTIYKTIVKEIKVPYSKYEYEEQKKNPVMSIVKTLLALAYAAFFIVLLVYVLKD